MKRRAPLLFAPFFVCFLIALLASAGCLVEPGVQTAPEDNGAVDTGPQGSDAAQDTGLQDSSAADTGSADTGEEDTSDPWADGDGDGRLDRFDNCPATPNIDQKDADKDGVGDACDNCPEIPNKEQTNSDGQPAGDACQGAADPDGDPDGDGLRSGEDNCPETANKDQKDADKDGVGDECDNCVKTANSDQADANGDGAGDACETSPLVNDADGDGLVDADDNCPQAKNMDQKDGDGDGVGDACDVCKTVADKTQADSDNDGVGDACQGLANPDGDKDMDGVRNADDNCPDDKNKDQKDADNDGVGDECDNCRQTANTGQKDGDGDGKGDACQSGSLTQDTDKDGVRDVVDNCVMKKNAKQKDADGDRVGDACDNCKDVANKDQKDGNNDGTGDACDVPPVGGGGGGGGGTDSDNDGLSDADEKKLGTDSNNPDSDGDGMLDGTEVVVETNPSGKDKACGNAQHTANLKNVPIDIIIVIDNSGSMSQEISGVERNINRNFATIMSKSGLDYRVIMISRRGTGRYDVCVGPPLGGSGCRNTNRFKHVNQRVNSVDSLNQILNEFNTYKRWLRPSAFKVILEISDDDPWYPTYNNRSNYRKIAQDFERDLLKKSPTHFGNKNNRNYLFHSIIGLRAKSNSAQAYKPNEPIVPKRSRCSPGGVDAAEAYQYLSKWTGGLRYPICNTSTYDAVFREIAKGIVQRSRIQCTLSFPNLPNGKVVKQSGTTLEWEPGPGQPTQLLTEVADKSKCGPGNFYVSSGKVKLCPQPCQTIHNATSGDLYLHSACVDKTCAPASNEVCGDNKDNDCDGKVDEGCPGPKCMPAPEVCGDMTDNDCDKQTDEGCPGPRNCSPQAEVCGDMTDNDCDMEVDEGCPGMMSCDPQPEVCGDMKDNDCDMKADEGCDPGDCTPEREVCGDMTDNDCDMEVDEGCPVCKLTGDSCSMDGECCGGSCASDGTCGAKCRPVDVSCIEDSECCSGLCSGRPGQPGKCVGS